MRTTAFHIGLILLVVVTTTAASAAQDRLPDGLRLRRMSLLLRGYLPSHRDIAELKATPESAREEFFQRKLKDYTSDVFFRRKFAWRAKSLFRLAQTPQLDAADTVSEFEQLQSAAPGSEKVSTDALTLLLAEEKSWDDVISSPAFAYQRELRTAVQQVQSRETISAIAVAYTDVAAFLGGKFDSETLLRIRAHLKGEKPIALSELQFSQDQVKEAATWAKMLSKYDIDVEIKSRTPQETLSSFQNLSRAIAEFERNAYYIVMDFRREFFSYFRPDYDDLTEDDDRLKKSIFYRGMLLLRGSSSTLYRRPLELSEIVLRSPVLDTLLKAIEDFLVQRREPPSGEQTVDLGVPIADVKRNLEASALKLWEEGQFQGAGLPVILSDELRGRYNQTKYSLSAAFYRIYFCDEMKLVALAKDDELSRLANQRLRFNGAGNSQMKPKTGEERHASDPLCQGCHRKLDPIQNIANRNGGVSKKIKIVYDDENGKEQSFTANSPAELIREIKSRRMYQICQVRRFWNWYIGEDVPLTDQRLEQMLTSYRNHRSIPEFVRAVVSQPEFSRIPQVTDKLTFEGVRPILSRCNDCHSTEALMPSFTQTPFTLFAKGEEARAEHVEWLRKIVKITDLVHGAKNAKMPPKEAGWTLDESAVHQLARWVYFLAPDAKGQPTITSTQRDQILADASPEFLEKITLDEPSKPSFRSTYRRYLEGIDFVKVVHQIFEARIILVNQVCTNTFSQKRFAFGWFDHLTGAPATLAPGGDFQMTWAKCVERVFDEKYPGEMTYSKIQDEIVRLRQLNRRRDRDLEINERSFFEVEREIDRLKSRRQSFRGPYAGTLEPVLPDSFLNELRARFSSRDPDRPYNLPGKIATESLLQKLDWRELDQGLRSQLIAHLVQFAYPDGIFPQATIDHIRADLQRTLDQLSSSAERLDLYEVTQSSLILLLSREEFLTL